MRTTQIKRTVFAFVLKTSEQKYTNRCSTFKYEFSCQWRERDGSVERANAKQSKCESTERMKNPVYKMPCVYEHKALWNAYCHSILNVESYTHITFYGI